MKNVKHLAMLKLFFISITLLICSSTVKAKDYSLASFVNNSKTFDLPIIEDSPGFTSFGSIVFDDANENGVQDIDEFGMPGLTVKLFDENSIEINVGPDGILGTKDDAAGGVITNVRGEYFFYRITHDFYRVQLEAE